MPFLQHFTDGNAFGRGAAGIEAVQPASAPDNGEGIAADTVGCRFHHREAGCGGNGGINGIAAFFKYLQAGLGGQRLGSGNHAVFGIDGHSLRRIRIVQRIKLKHRQAPLSTGFLSFLRRRIRYTCRRVY